MKKLISVLLATAMIFAVCAMPAFAISSADGVSTNDYPKGSINYTNGAIEGEGSLQFNPATRAVSYTVSCTNINYDGLSNFHLWAQCAINYADGSQDFDTVTIQVLIGHEHGTTLADSFIVPSNKTVVSLDAEYQIWHENGTLWEGHIYVPLT